MMDLIRINHKDLEDLRLLLLYYKENEMDVDDINKIILFLGNKYGFDPFICAINILTGIVSERKRTYVLYNEPTDYSIQKNTKAGKDKESIIETTIDSPMDNGNLDIQVTEKSKGVTKILINGSKPAEAKKKDPKEYLPELERWIKTNDLDYMKVRKLISDLQYSKRVKEVTPNLVGEDSEFLCEFQDWVESRDLDYLKLRMMLAILAQKDENKKREAVIAR